MEISLIISGNLTGFSRFYASPNANDVYNEAKFDFDYRNFLTFLNAGEKAYAISFSPKIMAVSLITRILDSFRRPGILVITALIPRYQLVCGRLNPNERDAIFKLLNEVNDKFYERNFLNGMVNQNPAVLMQDYYSDILSRYTLVSDRFQKPVNSSIDVTTPNKRIGYVAATDNSIPLYLSSLMRKSYEGYHHVFLSPHAPQNIDESAEEVLTYRVRIDNGNRLIPGEVRLTDRIPNISPEQGERDIPNKNFTYSQVISGDAGMDIVGSIENGDTIVLTYRFPKEEKTVLFKFYEGANEVPIALIRPILFETNGTSFNVSSESITFSGKEIYGRKTIKSGNPEYTVEGTSSNVDLLRVQNGGTLNVYVQRVWEMRYQFNGSFIIPKHIILTNKFTREQKEYNNITTSLVDMLTGRPNDWELEIYSDKYEPIRVPYGVEIKPVPKREANITSGYQAYDRRTNVNSSSNRSPIVTNPNSQGLKISYGENPTAKNAEQIRREKSEKYKTCGFLVVIAILIVFGGIWGYKALFGDDKRNDDITAPTEEPVMGNEKFESKTVFFKFYGIDGDSLSKATIDKLDVTLESSQIDTIIQISRLGYRIKYNQAKNQPYTVKINVSYLNCDLLAKDYNNIFEVKNLKECVSVKLSVKESDINLYDIINAGVAPEKFEDYSKKVSEITDNLNPKFGYVLAQILYPQAPNGEGNAEDAEKRTPKSGKESAKSNEIRSGFDALSLVLSPDKKSLLSNGNKLIPQNNEETNRQDALISVLIDLNGGKIPKQTPRALSLKQQKIINELRQISNMYKNDRSASNKLRSDLKKWKSLSQIEANIITNSKK